MSWQFTVYAYPTLLAALIAVALAGYALHASRSRERRRTLWIFAALNVAVAVWTGVAGLKLLSTDPATKLLLYRLLHVGSSAVGPLLLLFALAYTDRTRWLRRGVVAVLFAPTAAYVVLLFSNPANVAIVDTTLVSADGLVVMRTETGPAHLIAVSAYSTLLGVLTVGILVHETVRQGRAFLPQAALLIVAILCPLVVNVLTDAAIPPFHLETVNFVPASAGVSMLAIGAATVHYRLLDLLPVAYSAVVRDSPDGVLVLDPTWRVVHANDSVARLLGCEGAVGEHLDAVLPDVELDAEDEQTVHRRDVPGGAEYLAVRSRPLERHGDVVGWVLVLRDVTEQRRRERDLETVTGAVSHDLKQPLRTTDHYLVLLADHLGGDLDEEGAQLLSVARRNTRHMQHMIEDLLEYSSIEAEDAEFGPVDCEAVVADVRQGLRYEIEERGATVVADDLPTVRGVDHLLRRLFQNLIENALIHSGPEALEVRVEATRESDAWRFSVCDDGAGIPADERAYVTELFSRGSGRFDESGTGMGLAICERIVRVHGGTIDVGSSPGEGTTVTFTVPDGGVSADETGAAATSERAATDRATDGGDTAWGRATSPWR